MCEQLKEIRQGSVVQAEDLVKLHSYITGTRKKRVPVWSMTLISPSPSAYPDNMIVMKSYTYDQNKGDVCKTGKSNAVLLPHEDSNRYTKQFMPHSETCLLREMTNKATNPTYDKKVDFMWVDVSMSPCNGCYLGLKNFIDAQKKKATPQTPFKFKFSFNLHYSNDGRSDIIVSGRGVLPDPSSPFRQIMNTGRFLNSCGDKEDDKFQFEFVERYRSDIDNAKQESFLIEILEIYWYEPNLNLQQKVDEIYLEFDGLQAQYKNGDINKAYFEDKVNKIIDAFLNE